MFTTPVFKARTAVAGSLLVLTSLAPAAEPPAPVGTRVGDFTLVDTVSGKPWAFVEKTRSARATVVVFLATGCPVNNAYAPRLAALARRHAGSGVLFVGIDSHPSDDVAAVAKHAAQYTLPFPVLKDDGGTVADRFAVERVPTVYVLDATRTVRYKGRIDDQFAPGIHRAKATTHELATALDAVLAGREVTPAHVPAAGCLLTRPKEVRRAAEPITYARHVSRIFQDRCQECHRPGEAAPFSLLTYRQARGWADMIREVVAGGVMPPWHADAPPGHFKNDRRLTEGEKKTLLTWIDQGCPEGAAGDAPPPRPFVNGWRLGRTPDLVVKMAKPVSVPAYYLLGFAGMPYQYVLNPEPLAEDWWVQAAEVRPDYRGAVHHVIVYVIPPGKNVEQLDLEGNNFAQYMLATYVPGDQPLVYPDGFGRKVAKGSRLLFEMHYTPNGKAVTDQSAVGLIFAREKPRHEIKGMAILDEKFAIPPRAAAHEVRASHTFMRPTTLLSLSPHMHLRGKSFRYELVTPDGKREVLLNVPRYDFSWQERYVLARPRVIPAGSRIDCTARFDNSAGNPFNPNPDARVRWGDQTWEEMMIGFLDSYE